MEEMWEITECDDIPLDVVQSNIAETTYEEEVTLG
jgi:hypothetical protein